MQNEGRRIALITDNCPSHPPPDLPPKDYHGPTPRTWKISICDRIMYYLCTHVRSDSRIRRRYYYAHIIYPEPLSRYMRKKDPCFSPNNGYELEPDWSHLLLLAVQLVTFEGESTMVWRLETMSKASHVLRTVVGCRRGDTGSASTYLVKIVSAWRASGVVGGDEGSSVGKCFPISPWHS